MQELFGENDQTRRRPFYQMGAEDDLGGLQNPQHDSGGGGGQQQGLGALMAPIFQALAGYIGQESGLAPQRFGLQKEVTQQRPFPGFAASDMLYGASPSAIYNPGHSQWWEQTFGGPSQSAMRRYGEMTGQLPSLAYQGSKATPVKKTGDQYSFY
jgi:hypothetical protein